MAEAHMMAEPTKREYKSCATNIDFRRKKCNQHTARLFSCEAPFCLILHPIDDVKYLLFAASHHVFEYRGDRLTCPDRDDRDCRAYHAVRRILFI